MKITFFPQDHRTDLRIEIEQGLLTVHGPVADGCIMIQLSPQKLAELSNCTIFLLDHMEPTE